MKKFKLLTIILATIFAFVGIANAAVPKNGYTNEQLCKMALKHYYKNATAATTKLIAKTDSPKNSKMVNIHIYEIVDDGGGGQSHTATWAWITVNRKTGKGTDDIMCEEVDITK